MAVPPSSPPPPLPGTLGRRLAASLVAAITVCFVAYVIINLQFRRRELLTEAEKEVRDHGIALDLALNDLLRDRDIADLAEITEDLSRAERIHGVVVFDTRGRAIVASRSIGPRAAQLSPVALRALRSGHALLVPVQIDGRSLLAYAFVLERGAYRPLGVGMMLRDMGYIHQKLLDAFERTAVAALLVVLVAILVVLTLTRRMIVEPVGRLLVGVRRIAAGDLETALVMPGDDEISRVGRAVDAMRTALADARAEIRRDIERRVEFETLQATERRLQHAQRLAAVGQLAAGLAHEIGSPLHVIAGRARYAATRAEPAELRENLAVIAAQADRITRVVEQLLSVARRRKPQTIELDLREVLRAVEELVGPQARQQGVSLDFALGEGERTTVGDPDALQQVFFNLVLNALQAQPGGGQVAVTLGRTLQPDTLGTPREQLVVDVRDQGPGVQPELRERLFEPFATGRDEGTGLGLAIVRGIVRDHGGTVAALDPPDGGAGALFRVVLPAAEESRNGGRDA